jgi:superfamily II DNA helicase RecQ
MPLDTRKEVMESVRIPQYETVVTELDRPNLYYNIMATDMASVYTGEGRSPLDFILDEVRTTGNPLSINKTILYLDSPRQCKAYVKRLRNILPSNLQHLAHQLIQPY